MVVELVGAFNELTERMDNTLKLCIPILQSLPLAPDGRSPLSRALSVAVVLADLQVITRSLEAGAISIYNVRDRIGTSTAHLLHESLRVKHMALKVEVLDDDSATALRKFCLTYYDVRALVLDLAIKLNMLRHLDYLPRYRQQMVALEVMKLHAPLAHAIGTNLLSLELKDLSFRYLFPYSYLYLDAKISVEGHYKSRYSTMKKLSRDGCKLEEVSDILGLRVEIGEKACYRAREVVQSLWEEIPSRSKDYILRPKANGYKSLHMAVDTSENGLTRPLMEIQIPSEEMDILASGGTASHALYKGGVTDLEEGRHPKTTMMAAAELAALRLRNFPSTNPKGLETDERQGVPSVSQEMMQLLDSNSDVFISDEFDLFQSQVEFIRNLEDRDDHYQTLLNDKLQMANDTGLIQVNS
ncbi:unnamed protein product [Withania somnifera]